MRTIAPWVLGATLLAAEASAHGLRPALLELTERGGGRWDLRVRAPREGEAGQEGAVPLRVGLPPWCRASGARDSYVPFARVSRARLDCGARGMRGATLSVEGLGEASTEAVVRLIPLRGREIVTVLRADDPAWTVPDGAAAGIGAAVILGVRHILGGWDHLLFVLGLLALVRGPRALVATVSAFTLGHSVTLALAALGLARPAQAPVEAVIALSLVAVAAEVVAGDAAWRRPWILAAGFGLVHGFGFAGALGELGVEPSRALRSVAAFNAGVELGQLAVVAVALAVARLAPPAWRTPLARRGFGYMLGALAAWMVLDRMRAVLAL